MRGPVRYRHAPRLVLIDAVETLRRERHHRHNFLKAAQRIRQQYGITKASL